MHGVLIFKIIKPKQQAYSIILEFKIDILTLKRTWRKLRNLEHAIFGRFQTYLISPKTTFQIFS
jgi:transcriptional regulator of met regulon